MDEALMEKLLADYDADKYDHEGIKGKRMAERLYQLSKIGLTDEGGSMRIGFSKEERQAKELVKKWMREAGLNVREDGAGNVYGRLAGKNDALPAILAGSHVDTVPNGGHFDGTLGVVSALEVVEAWRESGFQPERPFEAVIFTDEEGSRFNGGYLGSKAMMGQAKMEELLKWKDGNGMSFEEVLATDGLTADSFKYARRNPEEMALYIEIHIEQGKRLEKAGLPCGIVNGIAGPAWFELTFEGKAGHAGSTPMPVRSDALVAAGKFIYELNKLPGQVSESAVATVGKLFVRPNGVNVIPGEVTLYADVRDIFGDEREKLISKMRQLIREVEAEFSVKVAEKELVRISPVAIRPDVQEKLAEAMGEIGVEPMKLPSGAGHDAMIVGEKIPVAMIFVKSKDGISHSPQEWSRLDDCVQAVRVLKKFVENY
ncbi:MAG TPA: M20 family metallo-hydrolase [Bacillaceae bacterium]